MNDTLDRVKKVVANQFGQPKEALTHETNFVSDLGADSLDGVELVMELEDEFSVSIPDATADNIRTIGGAVAAIEKELSNR